MKTGKHTGEELTALQQEKGNICVSVIVPVHRLSTERRTDAPEVKKAIHAAIQTLEYKYGIVKAKPLADKLNELYRSIDFNRNEEGLGLYVSPNLKLLVKFPFPVEEKIIAGDSFEVRDLLYKVNFSEQYFVLIITEREVKLLQGLWNDLTEIIDDNFPLRYEEEFIYSQPGRSTSYSGYAHVKSFEKDKSETEEIRYKDFFRKADKLLKKYMTGDTPLVITGSGKEYGWFEKITGLKKNIIGKIKGSYSHHSPGEIASLAWPVMFEYLQNKRVILLKEFEEKTGEHLAVSGIQQVWQVANEGRGFRLLVEKDYRCPGFVDKDANHLFLRPPRVTHIALADAVDDLIEIVLNKKGEVFFTDNGMLKDYQRIAMITRY